MTVPPLPDLLERLATLEAGSVALRRLVAERDAELRSALGTGGDDDRECAGLSIMWVGQEEWCDEFVAWYKPEDWFGAHRGASNFVYVKLCEIAKAAGCEGYGFQQSHFKASEILPAVVRLRAEQAALREALEALSYQHDWQPGIGFCVCKAHEHTRKVLAALSGVPASAEKETPE